MRTSDLNKKGIKVKCPFCKHAFETRSKLMRVTCASCGCKFRVERVDRKINGTND